MIQKITKIFLYLPAFLIPVFFLPFTQNVLDFPKQFLFLILASIPLFLFIYQIFSEEKIIVRYHPLLFIIFAFVLILGFSTLFSKSRIESFFGFPLPIAESFLTFVSLFFYLFLILNVFEKNEVFYLLLIFFISTFLAEIFGILQIFGKFIFPLDFAQSSSFNTIGTPLTLAIFLACLLPLLLILFSLSKRFIKLLFFLQIFLTIFLLVLINSKIAWLLLLLGTAFTFAFFVTKKEIFSKGFLFFPLLLFAICGIFLFFNFQIFSTPLPPEVSLSQRLSFKIGWESLKENPILGSGPATFIYNFSSQKGNALNDTVFWNIRFSNSASKFLDVFATTGVLGTFAFLIFIISIFYYGFRNIIPLKEKFPLSLGIFLSLSSFIFSFFLYVSNFTFVFSFFLLLAGFLTLISEKKKEIMVNERRFLTFIFALFSLLILFLDLGILIFSVQRYIAETYYLKGIKEWQNGKIEATLQNLTKASNIYPHFDFYFRDLSQVYLAKVNQKIREKDFNIQNEVANAINFANRAKEINPVNVANWSVRAFTYSSLIGVVAGAEDWALRSWDEAIKLEKSNPYFLTQKGMILVRKGILTQNNEEKSQFFTEAENLFKKAIELKADYAPAHFQLATLLQTEGKIKEAISKLEETKILVPFDVGLAFQLGLAYYQDKNYQKAKEELERTINLDPNYANALYFLSLTYDQLGEREKAIEKMKKVAELNPDNQEVKKIISNLENGKPALEGIITTVPPKTPVEERPPEIKD